MPFRALQDRAELVAAAAREGLELVTDDARVDTMGLDSLVVHARDREGTWWIVRAPRREDVSLGARVEARILAAVRPHLTAAVPAWRIHADDVIAYPRLGGTPAITLDTGAPVWNVIDPAALAPAFLDSLGQTLAELARVPLADGIPHETPAEARAKVVQAIAVTREALEVPASLLARWQRFAEAPWPDHVAWSHGDLHPGHLLLHDDARIAGVLDWTEARVSDPAIDFAMIHMCFGRETLDAVIARFLAHGGQAWPGLAAHAVERAAVFPALGVEWSVRTGNPAGLEHARGQLAALAE